MIEINGKNYRTLEEQVQWLTDNIGGGGTSVIDIVFTSEQVEDEHIILTDEQLALCQEPQNAIFRARFDMEESNFWLLDNYFYFYKLNELIPEESHSNAQNYDYTLLCLYGGKWMFGGVIAESKRLNIDFDDEIVTYSALDDYQEKLTAGANISISSANVISATDTTYTAGANVAISGSNVISATDTTYTAGTGISISGSNVISSTVSPGPTYTAGDGITISGNEISVKVGEGLFYDSNDAVCLNAASRQAIAAVATKSTVSGTSSGTNWTSLTVDGTTHNIPAAGTSYMSGPGIVINDNVISVDYQANDGLKMVNGDVLTVDYDIAQHKLTTDNSLQINNNQIKVVYGPGLVTQSNGLAVDYVADHGLMMANGDVLDIDYDVVQHKLTAADDTIQFNNNNTVQVVCGPGIYHNSGTIAGICISYVENNGLQMTNGDMLDIDYDVVQHKLTAGSNISIVGNTISATGSAAGTRYRHRVNFTRSSEEYGDSMLYADIINTTATGFGSKTAAIQALGVGDQVATGAIYSDTTGDLLGNICALRTQMNSHIFAVYADEAGFNTVDITGSDWIMSDSVTSF